MLQLQKALPILISATALLTGGCDLATTDIDAEVKVDFVVDATNNVYVGDFVVDPNMNADVRDNRSKIKEGEITDITIQITGLNAGNMATNGDAKLYFRKFATDTWAPGSEGAPLVSVGTTAIAAGTQVPIVPDAAKKAELAAILFADEGETKAEMRFTGMANMAPVKFNATATFKLKIKVGL